MKRLFLIFLIVLPMLAVSQPKIIFDTDFGGDADDLGALVMLNHLVNKGECEVLAVMCWNVEPYAVSAIDAVNRFYGNPEIPIGARKDHGDYLQWQHTKVIADQFPHSLRVGDVEESTALYRKLLAEAEEGSITIVTVGPLSNIQRLLDSAPDEHSPLSGNELIVKKVKEFAIMGGQFPSGKKEWNFDGDMPGVTMDVLSKLTVPITFSGFELGVSIKSGEVFNEIDQNTPLYVGFRHFSEFCPWLNDQYEGKIYDNATFDQTAVLYAVRGGVGDYWERIGGGYCQPDSVGGNGWAEDPTSNQSYLKLLWETERMAGHIEDLMTNNF